jgi:tetratricopeptide (TPR) repeat protein
MICASLAGRAARAEEPDKVAAEALFQAGRALMDQRRYPEACAKFVESQRLDPGLGTLFNLARCHAMEGKTATAWAEFREMEGLAKSSGQQKRAENAAAHAAELEPKLARLRIVAPSLPAGATLQRDSTPVGEALRDMPTPVDPASSPDPGAGAPIGSPARIAGFVLIGAGAAGVVAGAVLGGLTLADAHRASTDPALCPDMVCTPAGRRVIDGAQAKALGSSIALPIGLLAAAAGAVLVGTAKPPAAPAVTASAGPHGGGLTLTVRF